MNLPGFTAEASLGPRTGVYYTKAMADGVSYGRRGVVPQRLGFGGDPDLGEYLRCRANGGGELICRFFAGLPPFTIGGRLI